MFFLTVLAVSVRAFSLAEWTAKHGLKFHKEKLRWEKAARVCQKEDGHLVTVDCGSKEGYVRQFLREKNVTDSVWIGLNRLNQDQWHWHHSDSSSFSYANFVDGSWPQNDSCVLMKRGNSRNWMGAKCTSKRAFLCESNFIYPEVNINQYNVSAYIDAHGTAQIKLNVKFDQVVGSDSKDVPLTLVVPKNAVITKFDMLVNEKQYPATIRDCSNCNEIFYNSTQQGVMTAKLWRSKSLRDMNNRVLTIYNTVCGHHMSMGFELRYHYEVAKSKKRHSYDFEFRLAPGAIVGQIDFRLDMDASFRARNNIEQGRD